MRPETPIRLEGHVALVQPRVGIGDMVWHLPHLRALARHASGRITLVTRPRSAAHQLVGPADGIDDIFWVERDQWLPNGRHQGLAGMVRLVRELRACRFDSAVLLTRSRNLTLAMAAAGVPLRYGYGVGTPQRLLLGRPYLPDGARKRHPYDQATLWLEAAGVPLGDPEPRLSIDPAGADAACRRLSLPRHFAAIGIASSDAWKKWPLDRYAALAAQLMADGWPGLVLLGGPAEREDAEAILAQLGPSLAARVTPILGSDLRDVAALLSRAAFYVGNDTAVLNIAAAVGTDAVGLFGGTPVLRHSPHIRAIVPLDGPNQATGMTQITLEQVLAACPPLLPLAGAGEGGG